MHHCKYTSIYTVRQYCIYLYYNYIYIYTRIDYRSSPFKYHNTQSVIQSLIFVAGLFIGIVNASIFNCRQSGNHMSIDWMTGYQPDGCLTDWVTGVGEVIGLSFFPSEENNFRAFVSLQFDWESMNINFRTGNLKKKLYIITL